MCVLEHFPSCVFSPLVRFEKIILQFDDICHADASAGVYNSIEAHSRTPSESKSTG